MLASTKLNSEQRQKNDGLPKNAAPPQKKNKNKKMPTCIAAPLDGWTPSMTNEQGSIKQGRILVKGNMKEIFTLVDFFCV